MGKSRLSVSHHTPLISLLPTFPWEKKIGKAEQMFWWGSAPNYTFLFTKNKDLAVCIHCKVLSAPGYPERWRLCNLAVLKMFGLEDTLDQKLQQVETQGWFGTLCLVLVQSLPTIGTDLSPRLYQYRQPGAVAARRESCDSLQWTSYIAFLYSPHSKRIGWKEAEVKLTVVKL